MYSSQPSHGARSIWSKCGSLVHSSRTVRNTESDCDPHPIGPQDGRLGSPEPSQGPTEKTGFVTWKVCDEERLTLVCGEAALSVPSGNAHDTLILLLPVRTGKASAFALAVGSSGGSISVSSVSPSRGAVLSVLRGPEIVYAVGIDEAGITACT